MVIKSTKVYVMGRELVDRAVSLSDFSSAGVMIEVGEVAGRLEVLRVKDDGSPVTAKEFRDMLFTLGVSKKHPIEVQDKALHHMLNDRLVDDYRILGKERVDKDWLTSGYASEEAKLSSSRMKDMVSYSSKLQNRGE